MCRHGHGRGKNKIICLSQRWTARLVIQETDKEWLRNIITKQFSKPRNAANIECWQLALMMLMKELSQEELMTTEATAKEWNSWGSSAEAQYHFVMCGVYKVMKGFTEEMWKRGGLRLVILLEYNDDKGDLFSQIYDFNKNFANGPAFSVTDAIYDTFDKYLTECFPEAETDSKEHTSEAENKKVKKSRTVIDRDEMIKKITMEDRTTWIPDITDATRAEKQALVRAFLTSHYHM
ncbi:hypothetical protein EV363DRAFT_1170498 [Boletus edulis]|nr:hypothetical protein EV363DRAFT_1170498 [Boletus edulis]